jgi:hypothetical protein
VSDFASDGVAATVANATKPTGVRRRKKWVTLGAVLGVSALVVVIVVASGSTPGSRPTAAAAATVQRAVVATVGSHSVAFSISATENFSVATITIAGAGACSITDDACSMKLTASTASSPSLLTEQDRTIGTMGYLKFGPPLSDRLPTPWLSVTLNPRLLHAGGSPYSTNPLATLATLAGGGGSVTKLGSSTVEGMSATEYHVQISATTVSRRVHALQTQLPQWMRSSGATLQNVNENVWVAGHRVRKVSLSSTATIEGATGTVNVVLEFTSFGHPVVVAAPPSNQVTSYTSAINDLN